MIYLFLDLTGSTGRLAVVGEAKGIGERRRRMRALQERILGVIPTPLIIPTTPEGTNGVTDGAPMIQQRGPRHGDGLFFVATDDLGERLYELALEIHSRPHALPTRIALGRGVAQWDGRAWREESNIDGRVVDFTARIRDAADTGAVAMTREFYEMLPDELRRGATKRTGRFKGFEDEEIYWHTAAAWWLTEESMIRTAVRVTSLSSLAAVGIALAALVVALGAYLR